MEAHDQGRANPTGNVATEDPETRGGGGAPGFPNLPALRYFPADVLQMETAARGARRRRPVRSAPSAAPVSHATPKEVVSKILYLRQNYHFGPGKIADYLKRFHQITIATSSVHRILGTHGMNRLPANQKHQRHQKRWQRYEKAQPGHRLQLDVKFLERIPGTRQRLFQFTAISAVSMLRFGSGLPTLCPQAPSSWASA